MTTTVITNIGELVTNDPAPDDLLGLIARRRASWSRAAGSPGSARPPTPPPPTRMVDAGGRAVIPGFVDSHSHLVFAGDRADGVRGPDGRRAVRRRRHPRPPSPPPAPPPTSSSPRTSRRLVAEMRRQGTTTVEIKSGYGLTVRDEARSLAVARQFTEETTFLGAHVVPDGTDARATYVDLVTGPMLDGGGAARPLDRRLLRARRLRRRPGPARSSRPGPRPACAAGCTPTSSATAPASGSPPSSGLVAVDHCTYLDDADVDALARRRHDRDAAAGRGVLDPAALPRRPPAARRRRAGRAGQRLQPRLVLHQLDAAVHRAGRPRDGDDARRGAPRGDRRRRRGARPRRRRRAGPRPPGRPGGPRRPDPRAPGLPPRRPAGHRGLEGRPAGL